MFRIRAGDRYLVFVDGAVAFCDETSATLMTQAEASAMVARLGRQFVAAPAGEARAPQAAPYEKTPAAVNAPEAAPPRPANPGAAWPDDL